MILVMFNTEVASKFVNDDTVSKTPDVESCWRDNASTMLLPFQPFLGRGPFHKKCKEWRIITPPKDLGVMFVT